jgi:protein-tyrosine phosphatase
MATDYDFLRKHKITHVLDIGENNKEHANVYQMLKIKYATVALEDDENANLRPILGPCQRYIYNAIHTENGNILVHCMAGVSRSASVLASYFMRQNRWTLENALAFIRSKRQCIRPNPGFYQQLLKYQYDLQFATAKK